MTFFGTDNETKFEQQNRSPEAQTVHEIKMQRTSEIDASVKLAETGMSVASVNQSKISAEAVELALIGASQAKAISKPSYDVAHSAQPSPQPEAKSEVIEKSVMEADALARISRILG